MAKVEIKKPIIDEIKSYMQNATAIVILDYRGLTVEQDAELRRRMRLSNYPYKVYKNIYLDFSFSFTIYDKLCPHLDGPTSVAFSHGDYKELENIICEFKKSTPLSVKGAVIDGVYYASAQFYSKVAQRQQREADSNNIHKRLVGTLFSPISRFEHVLKAIAHQKQLAENEAQYDEWDNNYIDEYGEASYNEMLSSLCWKEVSDEVVITGIKIPKKEIWIPAKINGKPVVSIHGNPPSKTNYDDMVTRIAIPSSVTRIESFAFCGQNALESIRIPKSVTYIGERAFCSYTLKELVVEEGNSSYTSRNADGEECNAIIDIANKTLLWGCTNTTIPEGITTIAPYAFIDEDGLQSVVIPKTVQRIDKYSFATENIERIIVDPENETFTSRNFYGKECNAIIDLSKGVLILGCAKTEFPNYSMGIGHRAFHGCSGLEAVSLPNKIGYIADEAFMGCENLKEISMLEGIRVISDGAFQNCDKLTEIILPKSLERIGSYTFYGCKSLTKIMIPKNVVFIGYSAFSNCPNLKEAVILNKNLKYDSNVFDPHVKISESDANNTTPSAMYTNELPSIRRKAYDRFLPSEEDIHEANDLKSCPLDRSELQERKETKSITFWKIVLVSLCLLLGLAGAIYNLLSDL